MDQGREIGALAREALSGGTFVVPDGTRTAAEKTQTLINEEGVGTLYEATFEADGLIAKADILRPVQDGWQVFEVKSGTNDKDDWVQDLAYTVMVARRAGLTVSHASLMLVSRDFRLGMAPADLFVEIDHTEDVDRLVPSLTSHWNAVSAVVLGESRPLPEFVVACRACEHYATDCIGEGIDDPLFDLPRLSRSKFDKLKELGVNCITAIPSDFALTDNQARVRRAVVDGQPWKSPDLQGALGEVRWPVFYLDFETTSTAVPLYAGVAPHEQLATQYSIHVYSDPESELDHREFLADHTVDDRRTLTEKLLADLEGAGSIVVYSSFEKRMLKSLADRFPDLADRLGRCVERLLDLEGVIRKHYYDPGFHGRSSIKRTLPALVEDGGYDGLAIQNGADASALFARMARGERTDAECAAIRANLLAYCRQDTLAMVMVHRALCQRAT
jgi:hypothetical protein